MDIWFIYKANFSGNLLIDTRNQSTCKFTIIIHASLPFRFLNLVKSPPLYTIPKLGGVVIEVSEGSCRNLSVLGCNTDMDGMQSLIPFAVAVNQSYYIRVGSYDSSTEGNFSLEATPVIPNNDCFGAIRVDDGTNGPYSNMVSDLKAFRNYQCLVYIMSNLVIMTGSYHFIATIYLWSWSP